MKCAFISLFLLLCSAIGISAHAVDGNWTDWSSWSTCSVTNGNATQSRIRTCTNPPPSHNGTECKGSSEEYKNCVNRACWGPWSEWGSCSSTSGVGLQHRNRPWHTSILTSIDDFCEGDYTEVKICVADALAGPASPVVFHAHQPSDPSPASGKVIEYTVAEVNEGQGYNASNGVFTAPAGGLYMFTTQTCIWSNTFVLIAIVKEGVVIQPSALYHTSTGFAPCSSSQAFVRLFAGQRVWVESRQTNNGSMLYEDAARWTSFSGVLLQA